MEKISVTPKIRGLGNIVSVKSSDDFRGYNTLISSGTDTVDGKSLTVYQDYFQASPKLSLSYDKHIDPLSTSFTVSVTLETHSDSAISGATLYCDVNGTVQSGTTDSGGVVSFSIDLVDDVVKYEGLVYFMGTSGIARISQGFTVYALLPDSLDLFGNKDIMQTGDSVDFIATVLDEEDVGVPNVTVYFFEEYTPALRASASASVIQSGDDLDLYATLIDADDGSLVREPDVDVYFFGDQHLFDDPAKSDRSSDYSVMLCEGGTNPSMTYGSNKYSITGGSKTTMFIISGDWALEDCTITLKVKPTSTSFSGAIGLALAQSEGNAFGVVGYSDGSTRIVEYRNNSWIDASSEYFDGALDSNGIMTITATKTGNSIVLNGGDADKTLTLPSDKCQFGIMFGTGSTEFYGLKVKEVI